MYLLFSLIILIIFEVFLVHTQLRSVNRNLENVSSLLEAYIAGETEYEETSFIQEHVLEREAKFDERINQIRQELGMSEAEELHPDVKNLPHDEIKENRPPIEEYSI